MGSQAAVGSGMGPDGFWNTYSRYYDSVYQLMPYRKLLWDAFQALDLQAGARVLDAGCGTGNFEHFIAEKGHPPVEIDAIDFSSQMLERARRKCAHLDHIRFTQADLNEALPFADGAFDRIVSINVLYALADQDRHLAELLRVLQPEGLLVISSPVPNFRWGPLVSEHFGRIRNIWGTGRKAKTVAASIGVLATSAWGSFAADKLVIGRRESAGHYHSLGEAELGGLLERHRTDGLGAFSIQPAMASQNLFATAAKVLPA